jgi:hypothetical protein
MADLLDRATDREQMDTASSIQAHLAAAKAAPRLAPVGYCRNPACGLDFAPDSPKLFCDAGCEQEHRQRTR